MSDANQPDKDFEKAAMADFYTPRWENETWFEGWNRDKIYVEGAKFGRQYAAKELEAVQFKLEMQKDFVKAYSERVQFLGKELASLRKLKQATYDDFQLAVKELEECRHSAKVLAQMMLTKEKELADLKAELKESQHWHKEAKDWNMRLSPENMRMTKELASLKRQNEDLYGDYARERSARELWERTANDFMETIRKLKGWPPSKALAQTEETKEGGR